MYIYIDVQFHAGTIGYQSASDTNSIEKTLAAVRVHIRLMNMGKGGDGKVDGRKCPPINVNFRILKWRYVSTIFLAIFCRDILQSIGS